MAELCKKCFLETWHTYFDDVCAIEEDIVLSENNEICEGCGAYVPYVHHLGKDISCAEYDTIMGRLVDELIKSGHKAE